MDQFMKQFEHESTTANETELETKSRMSQNEMYLYDNTNLNTDLNLTPPSSTSHFSQFPQANLNSLQVSTPHSHSTIESNVMHSEDELQQPQMTSTSASMPNNATEIDFQPSTEFNNEQSHDEPLSMQPANTQSYSDTRIDEQQIEQKDGQANTTQ